MADNFIQPGHAMTWTNTTGSTLTSGSAIVIGNLLGVALTDIANTASGELAIEGVFELPKLAGADIGQGETVIWDDSEGVFDDNQATPLTGDLSGCCVAVEAAGNGATVVRVRLNVGPGTVAA